jgi:outer membrane protein TolC
MKQDVKIIDIHNCGNHRIKYHHSTGRIKNLMADGRVVKKRMFAITSLLFLLPAAVPQARGEETYSWRDCVIYTAGHNPELLSSLEAINQSKSSVGIARSAYLPQASASFGLNTGKQVTVASTESGPDYTRSITSNVSSMISNDLDKKLKPKTKGVTNSLSYGISGRQLVFDGLKTIYDIKSAETMVDDARYQYVLTSSQVRFNLRSAFVQLLKAQDSIAIYRDIVNRWKKNYDLVNQRYRAGMEHRGSLLNAEATLAQARLDLLQSERGVGVAQRSLLRQMGILSFRPVRIEGTLANADQDRNRPDFDSIMQSHPTVLRAMNQREAAAYSEKSRIASFLPVISASGSVERSESRSSTDTSRTHSSASGSQKSTDLSAGINISMPLLTGGSNYYNLKKAKSQSRKLKADEISAREQVMLDLDQKWNDWQNAIDAVNVQRKFLDAAQERAKIAEASYSIGLVLFDNWIIIENELAQRKKSYLEAKANELIAEAQWTQAKGETLAYDK